MSRQSRRRHWIGAGFAAVATLGVGCAVALSMSDPTDADSRQTHGFMHVNCPPGSHGKIRTLGIGADVIRAREAARAARERAPPGP
ncbi:MAG: hypothetical protein K2Y05_03245 [Hyphomicrobiaceae bacterium]|nr:hypothetical protein [Hyphomicrobiaceae bacterium]